MQKQEDITKVLDALDEVIAELSVKVSTLQRITIVNQVNTIKDKTKLLRELYNNDDLLKADRIKFLSGLAPNTVTFRSVPNHVLIHLKVVLGLTHDEIATIYHVTKGAVSTRFKNIGDVTRIPYTQEAIDKKIESLKIDDDKSSIERLNSLYVELEAVKIDCNDSDKIKATKQQSDIIMYLQQKVNEDFEKTVSCVLNILRITIGDARDIILKSIEKINKKIEQMNIECTANNVDLKLVPLEAVNIEDIFTSLLQKHKKENETYNQIMEEGKNERK